MSDLERQVWCEAKVNTMPSRVPVRVGAAVLVAASVAPGCGEERPSGPAVTETIELVDPNTARFLPHIPNFYDGKLGDSGLRVIAHTIQEREGKNEFLVAVENVGMESLCMLGVRSKFFDFSGNAVASDLTPIQTPLYRMGGTGWGTGSLMRCLGPGQVGMARDTTILADIYLGMLAWVQHDFSVFAPAGMAPADDVGLAGVQAVTDDDGLTVFKGRIENGSVQPVNAYSVWVFATNSVGRPIAATHAVGPGMVEMGQTWEFTTAEVIDEPFEGFSAYLDAHSP